MLRVIDANQRDELWRGCDPVVDEGVEIDAVLRRNCWLLVCCSR